MRSSSFALPKPSEANPPRCTAPSASASSAGKSSRRWTRQAEALAHAPEIQRREPRGLANVSHISKADAQSTGFCAAPSRGASSAGAHRLAPRVEPALHLWQDLWVCPALDDAVAFQIAQLLDEHLLRDAQARPLQLGEAHTSRSNRWKTITIFQRPSPATWDARLDSRPVSPLGQPIQGMSHLTMMLS